MWRAWLLCVVGCGRIAFDPLGEPGGGGSGNPDGDGGTVIVDDGGSVDGAPGHIGTGANNVGTSTMINDNLVIAINEANVAIIVSVNWDDAISNVASIGDNNGNQYTALGAVSRIGSLSRMLYAAPHMPSTTQLTITATFDQQVPAAELVWTAWRRVDAAAPVGTVLGATGAGTMADSGPVTVTAKSVLIGTLTATSSSVAAGSGFTPRLVGLGNLLATRAITSDGSYSATGTLGTSGNWIMHAVVLRPL